MSTPHPCQAEVDPNFRRTCGLPSTYNNGPCRGPVCTEAIRVLRADQRAVPAAPVPKKK